MTPPLLRFDVHARTGSELTGYGVGAFLQHLDALTHRDAKDFAATYYDEPVVVLPHRGPRNAHLERALTRLGTAVTKRDRHRSRGRR